MASPRYITIIVTFRLFSKEIFITFIYYLSKSKFIYGTINNFSTLFAILLRHFKYELKRNASFLYFSYRTGQIRRSTSTLLTIWLYRRSGNGDQQWISSGAETDERYWTVYLNWNIFFRNRRQSTKLWSFPLHELFLRLPASTCHSSQVLLPLHISCQDINKMLWTIYFPFQES